MKDFLDKHRDKITGTRSCFERIIFKGHLRPLSYAAGVESFLFAKGKRIKDFKSFVVPLAEQLKAHAQALASRARRPYLHLQRPQRNHDRARAIAERRHGLPHGVIAKIPHSRRWRTTKLGQAYLQFSINLHEQHFVELLMQKDQAA